MYRAVTQVGGAANSAPIGKSREVPHSSEMPPELDWKPYYEPATAPFSMQRSNERAQLGRHVGANLEAAPGMSPVPCGPERPVQMYLGDNFLSADECRALTAQIASACFPSTLFEQEKYAGVRTSQSCNLDVYDPLVAQIDRRLAGLLGIDPAWGEPLQGQRYNVGECFKDHVDFFYVDQPYWAEYASHGGQRTWTAMIYLTAPARGGRTRFTLLNVEVEAQAGRLLVWNNMAADGSPNGWVLHSGQPVDEGVKYVVTKWYRERPFS